MAVRVLVSDSLAEEGIERLNASEGVEVTLGHEWSREELLARIGAYDGLIVRSSTRVDRELIEAATSLRVIGRAGVGVDNIDLNAATKRGIAVINSPEGNTVSTAEHTIAMMAALARSIPQSYARLVRDKVWDRKHYVGVQLAGKVLGVLGLGRVGSEVARRGAALGMEIMGYDPFISEDRAKKLGVTVATVEEICRAADFITVHTPLTKETNGLISSKEFELMKDGVRIVNCARGGIIDETALYKAIVSGKVAGAALDVFVDEPPIDNPLLTLEQVIATPHLGASTHEAQINVAVDTVDAVVRALQGQPVPNAINAPALRAAGVDGLAPYLTLCERMGHFITHVFGGQFNRIEIIYRGKAAAFDEEALTAGLIKGMLAPILIEQVNYVNARTLAAERQMRIAVTKEQGANGGADPVTVRLRSGDRERSVSGGLVRETSPILTEIDGNAVNVPTEGRALVAYNIDRPGIIGSVGTLLGEHGVNIGFMQVGRKEVGAYAVMVLGIDTHLSDEVKERLRGLDYLKDVRFVEW